MKRRTCLFACTLEANVESIGSRSAILAVLLLLLSPLLPTLLLLLLLELSVVAIQRTEHCLLQCIGKLKPGGV